jgi:hypothetical protein
MRWCAVLNRGLRGWQSRACMGGVCATSIYGSRFLRRVARGEMIIVAGWERARVWPLRSGR